MPLSRDEELQHLHETLDRLRKELNLVSLRLHTLEQRPAIDGEPTTTATSPPPQAEPIVMSGPPPVIPQAIRPAPGEPASAYVPTPQWDPDAKPPTTTKPSHDMEMHIGAMWFNRIGALILLAGVAFFVKYSFEQGWISPLVRVLMGAATGVALIVGGEISLRRQMRQFAVGLIGAGVAMLYIATYGAHIFYELITSDTAFSLYCIVTALGAVLAFHSRIQAIAVLTILGAFATPPALQTHQNAQVALLTYLLIVDIGFLSLGTLRQWNITRVLCWLGTFLLFAAWGDSYYEPTALWTTLGFILAFYLVFHTEAVLSAKANTGLQKWLLPGIIHANNVVFFISVCVLIDKPYHDYLGLFCAVTGATQWLLAWLIRRDDGASQPSHTSLCIDGAVILALAAPAQFDGRTVVIAWGVQAVLCLWFARRIPGAWLRAKAIGILIAAAAHLILFEVDDKSLSLPLVQTRLWHLNRLILCFFFLGFAAYGGAICLAFRRTMSTLDKAMAGLLVGLGTFLFFAICAHQYDRFVATWCWVGLCMGWALVARWNQPARFVTIILAFLIVGKFLTVDLLDTANNNLQMLQGVVLNRAMLTALFVAVASMTARRLSRNLQTGDSHLSETDAWQALFWVLTPIVLIAAGTFEIIRIFRFEHSVSQRFVRPDLAMHVGLSVLWSLGATIVLSIGIIRLIRSMRYLAIILFAITIMKVMTVDLSYLETIYRVVSFIVLGVLLLLASLFYQRRWKKIQSEPQSPASAK